MGAVNSCWVPRREFHENHVSTPKVKGHRRNLSAAFNLSLLSEETEAGSNLLNINTAPEEELMTLPGINRLTAHHIVEYRRRIGGFRKVEDLALVSGVGATKLGQIREEITVSNRRPCPTGSRGSSVESSNQDLTPSEKESRKTGLRTVNVNTANVFQLMKVKGIGQAVAENIVSYRDKKGPYKSLDDLIKVKRIGPALLGSVRYQLTLTDSGDDSSLSSAASRNYTNGDLTNRNFFLGYTCSVNETGDSNANVIQQKKQLTKDSLNLTASQNDLFDILGPLATRPSRPHVLPYTFRQDGRTALRIASWDLQQCGVDKASNPGVRDIVCMTVLENGFGIMATHGLLDQEALQRMCEELNFPVLPNVKRWAGHRGSWECVTSSDSSAATELSQFSGFLYDKSQKVSLVSSSVIPSQQTSGGMLFTALFKVDETEMVLVCPTCIRGDIEATPSSANKGTAPSGELGEALEEAYPDQKNVVVLGYSDPGSQGPSYLAERGYVHCVKGETCIKSEMENQCPSPGGIWVHDGGLKVTTGRSGVVRDGLHSPWIPDGWKWGGVASELCPVWIEIYSTEHANINQADVLFSVPN